MIRYAYSPYARTFRWDPARQVWTSPTRSGPGWTSGTYHVTEAQRAALSPALLATTRWTFLADEET